MHNYWIAMLPYYGSSALRQGGIPLKWQVALRLPGSIGAALRIQDDIPSYFKQSSPSEHSA